MVTFERELDREADGLVGRLAGGKPSLLYTALMSGLRICCYHYTDRPKVTLLSASRCAEGGVAHLLPTEGTVERRASFKDALRPGRHRGWRGMQIPAMTCSNMVQSLTCRRSTRPTGAGHGRRRRDGRPAPV
jgi:hypothetical protein